MDGTRFRKTLYPKLAEVYEDCTIPDLRGVFIRGLGGNSAELLKAQTDAIRNITGQISSINDDELLTYADTLEQKGAIFYSHGSDKGRITMTSSENWGYEILNFDASRVVPTANENRPKNKAFNYICWSGEYYI